MEPHSVTFCCGRLGLGFSCVNISQAVLTLCPSDSCSPTEEHMACTSESTVNFFGNKALLLHQENKLHSNKFSSGKWLGLRDRWCGCKFTFLAK